MEWKRVAISSSELEKRAQQYKQEALNMMKKAKFPPAAQKEQKEQNKTETEKLPPKSEPPKKISGGDITAENISAPEPQKPAEDVKPAESKPGTAETGTNDVKPAGITREKQTSAETGGEMPEIGASCDLKDRPGGAPEKADKAHEEPSPAPENSDEKVYGLFTAEEILNSDKTDKAFREAAKALEEMNIGAKNDSGSGNRSYRKSGTGQERKKGNG